MDVFWHGSTPFGEMWSNADTNGILFVTFDVVERARNAMRDNPAHVSRTIDYVKVVCHFAHRTNAKSFHAI